jgi:uncharacterized integral membrane protein
MSEPPKKHIRRQRLGLRLDTTPYYTIAEHTDTCLVLQSRPDANARPGYVVMGCGTLVGLLTPILIMALIINGSRPVNDAFFGALLGWPFILIAVLAWNSGRALATTSNTITVDQEARTIVYVQHNRVHRQRSQTLQFDQIARLRLRLRWFKPFGLFQRRRKIAALEMVTDEDFTWLVDSAAEAADLMPTAAAMSDVLGLPLTRDSEVVLERELPGEE